MRLFNELLLVGILFFAAQCGHYIRQEISPGLEELVVSRQSELIDGARWLYINAEKCEFVSNAIIGLDSAAISLESEISNVLTADARDAYKAERESFAAWYLYQRIISDEVIGDIYQLYAGGSAGASFALRHLFDIANACASEQQILYEALTKQSLAGFYDGNATFRQIDSAKVELCADIRRLFYQFEDIGSKGYPVVNNTPSQLGAFLDRDLDLFGIWIADRKVLEPLLKEGVSELYASNTAYWLNLCLRKYQEGFISGRTKI